MGQYENNKRWIENNKDKWAEYRRKYETSEKGKEARRKYRERPEVKEKLKKYQKEYHEKWRKDNKEKLRKDALKFYHANKERIKEQREKRKQNAMIDEKPKKSDANKSNLSVLGVL